MDINLAILAVIILIAYMVGATTGFGGAMISITVAVHLYPVDFLVPVLVLLNLAISMYIVVRHHQGVDWKLLFRKIIPLTGIGLPVGLVLFNFVKMDTLKTALGVFIICLSLFELAILVGSGEEDRRRPLSPVQSAFWLFLGGVMHGMYASGGPLVAYYAGRNIQDKRTFRSTLSALWLILNTILLIVFLSTGKLTAESAWVGVFLLPFLAIGIAMGEWLHPRLAERNFRILVFSILVLAGISVLF